ncbi:helix-turn-helix transcriptional regulator [Mycolicibacterium flavescens]|uniref:Transcriptional regulator n=1 Tax=Mycolicibacterium flavescens TaxID=1776 RepID=A0A1E3RNL3_MYCFV|nr:helix-turn-helix domain-containing protein [Mycolicibacterium flavescens]MCV7278224.1 helix-turn-helix transcriptional regulator [Mycolicibacterium flavescens]ODQ91486.1 transcriptional regulator [Mycolicibacterium flavescens]
MTGPAELSHRFEVESVERTLALVGERWTFVILREIFLGVHRFGQLVSNLDIPRPTLATRLRSLVEHGLLVRVPYTQDPERFEYRLTDSGRDLFPAVVALMQWGDKHLPVPQGPPVVLRHKACGQIAEGLLLCSQCHQELTARTVTPEPGPGFGGEQP